MRSKPRFLLLGTALLTALTLTPVEASPASVPCSGAAAAVSAPTGTSATARRCWWTGPYRCCTYAVGKHQFVKRCMRARTRY
ncbi:hypothetical protein [Planotetraspora mira]|jgi:hypothetical protein|uniref:Secreted protein n=1 Tax=Planotetraspora mira TaxID=58121 RepID=A0A8J3TJT2_9ACTN|nr:hypothetical protein [Planotetraspora mira]GII27001.1 hypothetical protein Pmi06nite_04430 [Planotetraspora mira]